MLKIIGKKYEVDLVGKILNTVLEMLGGDMDYDGFGYFNLSPSDFKNRGKEKRQTTVTLQVFGDYNMDEKLELIWDAIQASSQSGGLFSEQEDWLENYRSYKP